MSPTVSGMRSVPRPLRLVSATGARKAEGLRIGEMGGLTEEAEAAGGMGGHELLQEQSPEQAGEHAHREEEARPARHPALAVERDAAARHDHVDVGMVAPTPTIP